MFFFFIQFASSISISGRVFRLLLTSRFQFGIVLQIFNYFQIISSLNVCNHPLVCLKTFFQLNVRDRQVLIAKWKSDWRSKASFIMGNRDESVQMTFKCDVSRLLGSWISPSSSFRFSLENRRGTCLISRKIFIRNLFTCVSITSWCVTLLRFFPSFFSDTERHASSEKMLKKNLFLEAELKRCAYRGWVEKISRKC